MGTDFHMPDSWYDPPDYGPECECDCDSCVDGDCEACGDSDSPCQSFEYDYEEPDWEEDSEDWWISDYEG